MSSPIDYKLFVHFLETYKHTRFLDINTTDPLVAALEEKLIKTRQFFHISDLIQLQVLYISKGFYDFFGQVPAESYPFAVYEASHPENKQRHSLARAKLIKLAQDMYNNKWRRRFLTTNLKIRNVHGNYIHLAFQGLLVFSEIPNPTVFLLMLHTDIGEIAQIKHGYHFYAGPDESIFSYPDNDLLSIGNVFTNREFEIIKCIASGMNSQQIADKLYLSVYTVNTHRRNILAKSNKNSTLELVIDLQEKGVI